MSRSRASAASLALATALAAVAFGAAGGNQLERTTIVEVAVVLVAGIVLGVAALRPTEGRPFHGATALALFGLLAAITGLSMDWSIATDLSLGETSRTLAYLGAFAAALMCGRLAPSSIPVVLGGVLGAGVAVAGWALATRIWPDALAEDVIVARLSDPLGYWNALGGMAATALPAALWLGTRREGNAASRALAYPALGILLLTILLTQSRGALGAAAAVTVLWLVIVPLRLRSLPPILVSCVAVAPVAAWALSKDAFTKTLQEPAVREAVAGTFGAMCGALVVVLFVAGLAVDVVAERRAPSLELRRRVGIALVAAGCLAPLLLVTSVAASDRGIRGTISDLTDDEAKVPGGGARLGSVSSSRGPLWRQAREIFEDEPLLGTGAGTFALARLEHRNDGGGSRHAHGFLAQTLADLGAVGVAVALALLAAWLAAVGVATGFLPRGGRRPLWSSERVAVAALALCPVAFGLQSFIDWTWSVPGPAVAALVAAGFVAGRGPLRRVGEPGAGEGAERGRLSGLLPAEGVSTGRGLLAAAVLVTTLLCAWATWQPERSARASERAFDLAERGHHSEALRQANRAREIDPNSAEPLYALAAVHAARDRDEDALRALQRAAIEHPRDPEPRLRLAAFELDTLHLPRSALATAESVFQIDPFSNEAGIVRDRARAELEEARPRPRE